jgi:hypothetical protein
MIWCNWDQISISFDVSNSTMEGIKQKNISFYISNTSCDSVLTER